MWEIIDNTGTIHSGNAEEMTEAFDAMTTDLKDFSRNYNYASKLAKEIQEKYRFEWTGDLKLIKVISISR
jgi:pyruvate-formate lyase-activating enzyme